jgi:hypothetical protein
VIGSGPEDRQHSGGAELELAQKLSRPVISVRRQSNSRGWLHRAVPRKRHQMRHLCDLTCLFAKQVLSQLSYTPTYDHLILMDFSGDDYLLPLVGAFVKRATQPSRVTTMLPWRCVPDVISPDA